MSNPVIPDKRAAEPVTVSVVVASYNSRRIIADCLRSLEDQIDAPWFEVIVVDSSADDTLDEIAHAFPWVRRIALSQRMLPGGARNLGVAASSGQILAFTDADCIVDRNWISTIVKAHARGVPVIGGAIDNANTESLSAWAYYFCDLAPWMPATPAGEVQDLPGASLTMKRSAWDAYGPFAEDGFGSDTAFCWKLARAGLRPFFDPEIRVAHRYDITLAGFVKRQLLRGRFFGASRATEYRWSWPRRLLGTLVMPVAAARLFLRKTRKVWKIGLHRRELLLSSPLVLMGTIAWYLGQSTGYLAGAPSR